MKYKFFVLILVLALGVCIAACAGTPEAETGKEPQLESKPLSATDDTRETESGATINQQTSVQNPEETGGENTENDSQNETTPTINVSLGTTVRPSAPAEPNQETTGKDEEEPENADKLTQGNSGQTNGQTNSQTKPGEPILSDVPRPTKAPTESAYDIYADLSDAFERYTAMSGDEQQRFLQQHFDGNLEAFINWHNAAKQEYNEKHPAIEIGPDGKIPSVK